MNKPKKKFSFKGFDLSKLNPSEKASEGLIKPAEDNYFKKDGFISNSQIGNFFKAQNDFRGAYYYGTAQDLLITESDRFWHSLKKTSKGFEITDEAGQITPLSPQDFKNIILNEHCLFSQYPYLKKMSTQKVIRNNNWQPFDDIPAMRAKIKMDFSAEKNTFKEGIFKGKRIIIDLKSTTAKTKGEFIERAEKYNYWRQGVFYSSVYNADYFALIGLSRPNINHMGELYFVLLNKERRKKGWRQLELQLRAAQNRGLLKEFYSSN